MSGLYWKAHLLTREMHVKREKAKEKFLGKEDGIGIAVNEGEKEEYYCFKPAAIGEVDGVGSLPRLTLRWKTMKKIQTLIFPMMNPMK
jgi:hypothetical protein